MIVAEIGSTHDGSFGNACKLVEVASDCGADIVKFQVHIPDAESLVDAPNPAYFHGEPRYEYFARTSFPQEDWIRLKQLADDCGIQFFASPFSNEAVDLLERLGVFGYKIASGEVTNLPLLEKIAQIGKPVFLSSGMSNWTELDAAVAVLIKSCTLTVLQCSSIYPCPAEKIGLNVIADMKERYDCAIGFSDHSFGITAALAATAIGVSTIEKHLTLSRYMYGSDAKNSLEPEEFKEMVRGIREIEQIMKYPIDKNDTREFENVRSVFQKSIVAAHKTEAGTRLTMEHLAFKKPGDGITANKYKDILGNKLKYSIEKNEKFTPESLE